MQPCWVSRWRRQTATTSHDGGGRLAGAYSRSDRRRLRGPERVACQHLPSACPSCPAAEHAWHQTEPTARTVHRGTPRTDTSRPDLSRPAESVVGPAASVPPTLRRSPHCGGRSTPSRDEPLTARLVARPAGERSGAPERVEIISFNTNDRMPTCRNCRHAGEDHDWISPRCSRKPYCRCLFEHPKRLRGQCLKPHCICSNYLPSTESARPVNLFIQSSAPVCARVKLTRYAGGQAADLDPRDRRARVNASAPRSMSILSHQEACPANRAGGSGIRASSVRRL